MKRILNIVGARPNFMKIAPIHRQMQREDNQLEPILIHTGQHYDERMSKFFFDDLKMPKPDEFLGVGSGSHAEQTARVMVEFEKVCQKYNPDLVLVVGDVNSTMACSITAKKLWIPVAHVEAGLRSFDHKMPEEINRLATDAISDFLFVSERNGEKNLVKEGVDPQRMFYVGNVMIDSLVHFMEIAGHSSIMSDLSLNGDDFVLITMHRPSNVDDKTNFTNFMRAFETISKDIKVIFPIHPRAEKNLEQFGLLEHAKALPNLKLLPPLGYLDFIQLEKKARFVITDSGGLQEETTFLGKPCLTVRENTERPITVQIGTNELIGVDTDLLVKQSRKILNNQWKKGEIPEGWDGKAAERIVSILDARL